MSDTKDKMRKKKDHGAGSITQRKDGIWTARIQIGTSANGKPKIKAFYGKTESEVKKKLKEFKNEIPNLSRSQIELLSFQQYIENWLYTYRSVELKPTSFDRLESTIKNYIVPNLGYLQLSNIKPDDIQLLINKMIEDGLSHSSIKKVYDALNACFKFALIKNDINRNPILGASMPSVNQFEKKQIKHFTKDEIKAFKNEAIRKYATDKSVYEYGHSFVLMLNTGIRESEMSGIKKTDIDLKNNTLHIQRNVVTIKKRDKNNPDLTNGYTNKIQDSTKTYSGDRIIPLNKSAKKSIEYLINLRDNSEFLISSDKGNIIPPNTLSRIFSKILIGANIEPCGMHTLRHTFASRLFEKGVDVKVVSELLGHSDVAITYNTYIHLIKKQKVKAVESFDDLDEDE